MNGPEVAVRLTEALIWPVVIAGATIAFRQEIKKALTAISTRISDLKKLTVPGGSAEFEKTVENVLDNEAISVAIRAELAQALRDGIQPGRPAGHEPEANLRPDWSWRVSGLSESVIREATAVREVSNYLVSNLPPGFSVEDRLVGSGDPSFDLYVSSSAGGVVAIEFTRSRSLDKLRSTLARYQVFERQIKSARGLVYLVLDQQTEHRTMKDQFLARVREISTQMQVERFRPMIGNSGAGTSIQVDVLSAVMELLVDPAAG